VGSRATTNLTLQVRQLELHPYPIVVELLDHDPRHRAPNQRRLVRRWLERVSCRVPVVQRERGRFLGGEYPVGSTGTELRSRKIWSGCARQAQGVPSAHIIRGSARFAECGLRAWPMGAAPPPPASRCGRPPHPTARFEGHVMRRNHPPVRPIVMPSTHIVPQASLSPHQLCTGGGFCSGRPNYHVLRRQTGVIDPDPDINMTFPIPILISAREPGAALRSFERRGRARSRAVRWRNHLPARQLSCRPGHIGRHDP